MGRNTFNLASDAAPAHSSIESLPTAFTEPLPSALESSHSSVVWQLGEKSPVASVGYVEESIQFTPLQTSYGNDSSFLQNEELDVRSGRHVKRAKQNYNRTSDGHSFLPKQETASPVIRSISTHTESDNVAYTGPASNPARVVRAITPTNQNDKAPDLIDGSAAIDPSQIRQHDEHRKYWASCSMDQWRQDGEGESSDQTKLLITTPH